MRPAHLTVEPLSASHDRNSFSSGAERLDLYFRHQAGQDIRRRVASCFVLAEQGKSSVLGYYTLASSSVELPYLPADLARKLPKYPQIPVTLMGRLAVDAQYRGQGFGELLLLNALKRALKSEIATFALVVDAKDEAAEKFYRHYDFKPLIGRRLLLPLSEAMHRLDEK